MEILNLLVIFLMLGFCLVYWLITRPKEQGTLQERRNNPELNTNKISIHTERLLKLRKSKFKGVMYHQGPRGGRYYYSRNGNKVYV